MRLDRILAIGLIFVCLIAALGNWLGSDAPRVETAGKGVGPIVGASDIALIEIYGLISDEATTGPFAGANRSNSNTIVKICRQARKDGVKAILLQINSPGGTLAASQTVYDELMRIRQETDIKIVANLGDVAASGGYYIASAADHIVANPGTLTGSIGVIIQTQNISDLFDKIGVQTNTIQSGQYKDILSPFRGRTEDEQALLQEIVAQSYQQFLDAIVAGRGIAMEALRPLADGRIFTGEQALEVQLVDSLGNTYDAIQKAAELANIEGEPSVRNYSSITSLRQSLGIFLSSSLEHLIPYYQEVKITRWNNIPLALRR
ncbi:MAG: signal peptide peptidase SppA [Leptolyngbyaceae cyanobacterium MO_188.B28]|nr:signal peptide peptidase SppA [Leptolyngbyaceae cyanobacterium MO_188.B28]